jgi:hypothetical protein
MSPSPSHQQHKSWLHPFTPASHQSGWPEPGLSLSLSLSLSLLSGVPLSLPLSPLLSTPTHITHRDECTPNLGEVKTISHHPLSIRISPSPYLLSANDQRMLPVCRWATETGKKIYAPLNPHDGYEALPTDGDEEEKKGVGHLQRLIENRT